MCVYNISLILRLILVGATIELVSRIWNRGHIQALCGMVIWYAGNCFVVGIVLETCKLYATYCWTSATQLVFINPTLAVLKREVMSKSLDITMQGGVYIITKMDWILFC